MTEQKTVTAFPLQWPSGWKRTPKERRVRAKFKVGKWTPEGGRARQLTITDGNQRVRRELHAMGSDDIVVSSMLKLRLDGMPNGSQATENLDPGVAVYWMDGDQQRCMAIDQYDRLADNLGAIAATLEAMRAIERHGGAEILNRAFTGFAALPAKATQNWRQTLGLQPDRQVTRLEVKNAFRDMARMYHPDTGANPSTEKFTAAVEAQTVALKELGGAD